VIHDQAGLLRLTEQVHRELELLDYPRRDWMPERAAADGMRIYDVLIVGAGQGGLASAFALMRERIQNILIVDENPLGRAGPWLNFARMHTLRTPKHVLGPDLGVPSLTARAWFEAQHGQGSWGGLGLLPKEDWAAYLNWYRVTLSLPVQPSTRVGALRYRTDLRAFEVPCHPVMNVDRVDTVLARRVVLATGIEGSGEWTVPAMISAALPQSSYAHTRWEIDFDALRGKRVAVLGAGASAFDNASTALEHDAGEVRLFFRRKQLVNVNPYRWAEFAGFLGHHADLPDADRYRFIHQILRMGQLPPTDTYHRALRQPNFHLQSGAGWRAVERRGDAIMLHTDAGDFETDFIIAATGFNTDLSKRPELAELHPHIALWRDRYTPSDEERNAELDRHPYLGPSFQYQEREPGRAPYLGYVYNYTFGCLLSLGFGGASISGMKYSIGRLTRGIAGSLFCEDREHHYATLRAFDEREF
jgi:cation diffusion facilitator CzcD-associated flavoprotein CzcO